MYIKFMKSFFDRVAALIALIIFIIPFIIIAIIIKFDSQGPVFFRQRRVGKDKKPFTILKFRTMYVDTPSNMPTHMLNDADRHITKIGALLRKTSLDEIPQFINVLKGDMSVIGPRPCLYTQTDLLKLRDLYNANTLRPGVTGWAQIHGRDELPIDTKAKLDGYYARNVSFLLDVKCFFLTFATVITKKGIVEGKTE